MAVVGVVNNSDDRYFCCWDHLLGIVAGCECAERKGVALAIDKGAVGGDDLAILVGIAPLQPSLLVADADILEANNATYILDSNLRKLLDYGGEIFAYAHHPNIATKHLFADVADWKIARRGCSELYFATYACEH